MKTDYEMVLTGENNGKPYKIHIDHPTKTDTLQLQGIYLHYGNNKCYGVSLWIDRKHGFEIQDHNDQTQTYFSSKNAAIGFAIVHLLNKLNTL